jgi:HEAT repeat protein
MMKKENTFVDVLVTQLAAEDGRVRQHARIALVNLGEPAVEPLIRALGDVRPTVHWEAIKTLSQIGSPRATQALIWALQEPPFGIRWMAAEGLAAIGAPAVTLLLQALIEHSDSHWLRAGAHHVFHDLIRSLRVDDTTHGALASVLAALDDIQPALTVLPAALHALQSLHQPTAMLPQPEVIESHLGAEQARLNNGQNTGRTEA